MNFPAWSITLIAGLVLQLAGVVWWASGETEKVTEIEKHIEYNDGRLDKLADTLNRIRGF